jgi:hypothetical protein
VGWKELEVLLDFLDLTVRALSFSSRSNSHISTYMEFPSVRLFVRAQLFTGKSYEAVIWLKNFAVFPRRYRLYLTLFLVPFFEKKIMAIFLL